MGDLKIHYFSFTEIFAGTFIRNKTGVCVNYDTSCVECLYTHQLVYLTNVCQSLIQFCKSLILYKSRFTNPRFLIIKDYKSLILYKTRFTNPRFLIIKNFKSLILYKSRFTNPRFLIIKDCKSLILYKSRFTNPRFLIIKD